LHPCNTVVKKNGPLRRNGSAWPDCRCGWQSDDADPCHKESQAIPLLRLGVISGWRSPARKGMRVPAGDIEGLVLDRLRMFFSSRTDIGDALAQSLVRDIVERVIVAADRIEIRIERAQVATALQAGERGQRPDLDPVVLSIEAKLRHAGKGKRLVIGNDARADVNEGLVELIKEAFAIRNQFLSGSDDSIEAMSGRLGMTKCRLTHSFDFLTSRRKLSALYSQVDIPLS
jgi:hypothetical protein